VEAAGSGAVLDLSTGDPALDDPANGADWPGARTVPSDLVAQLVTGEAGKVRAVRLKGARLVGVLDLEAAVLTCPLTLENCHFDEPINLKEAQAAVIRLPGCHVPGIDGDQLHVRGNLELDWVATTMAGVQLLGAHIGGAVGFSGANLTNPSGYALNAANVTVDRGMFCREGFTAQGEVNVVGAHIGGSLEFDGASLTNPNGYALNAANVTVDRGMFCREGFTAQGEVNVVGAHIGGSLDFGGAGLTNPNGYALNADSLTVDHSVYCREDFTTQGEVSLLGAHIGGQLDLSGASLTNPNGCALNADSLTVERSMYCDERFRAQGEVRLLGAHIGGSLEFDGASLTNPNGDALNASNLTVTRDIYCRDGFTARGGVRLVGAHIGGSLDFDGASLINPNGYALSARSLTVDQSMFCRNGFTTEGEVRLVGAHIGGSLDFAEASLTNSDGLALDLERASADALFLVPRERPIGVVDLTNARVGSFHDAPDSWPTAMRLRGFVYEVLENDSISVRARLGWLTRHQGRYAPGPYDQLAAAYRRSGHTQAARRVGIAKQWHRRRDLNPLGTVWNWLLYLTVGYGYRTWLAGLWLVGLLAVGAAIFAGVYPGQFRPASPSVPGFQPVAYALDVLLPIVDLGQEKNWFPQDSARVWSWVLTGSGWLLTTAVVAGLTNALKRD